MVILPSYSIHDKTKDRRRGKEGMEETTGKIEDREKNATNGSSDTSGEIRELS